VSGHFNLGRFVSAQDSAYSRVVAELRAGRKHTHWMWFVFPQVSGLGYSATAREFAIASLAEAKAYLARPLLGTRLRECTQLVLAVEGQSALAIFGTPDDLKFRSSMTLFAHAAPHETLFRDALVKYFDGEDDPATLERL